MLRYTVRSAENLRRVLWRSGTALVTTRYTLTFTRSPRPTIHRYTGCFEKSRKKIENFSSTRKKSNEIFKGWSADRVESRSCYRSFRWSRPDDILARISKEYEIAHNRNAFLKILLVEVESQNRSVVILGDGPPFPSFDFSANGGRSFDGGGDRWVPSNFIEKYLGKSRRTKVVLPGSFSSSSFLLPRFFLPSFSCRW